jgi:hypothetical protein
MYLCQTQSPHGLFCSGQQSIPSPSDVQGTKEYGREEEEEEEEEARFLV